MQGCFEPGNRDIIDIGPTVSYSNWEERYANGGRPNFIQYFIDVDKNNVILDSIQSEEGGRFYKEQNRNMIILADNISDKLPEKFIWMTLYQLNYFTKFSNILNIQARNLISVIPYNR